MQGRGASNNLDNTQIYKILFSLHNVCFNILPSNFAVYNIVWVLFIFLNKWMNFLFVWALGKMKLFSSSFILKEYFPLYEKL